MISARRGGALLTVLWLSAALSAIAFSVATTVRGEIERAATASDGVKGYFLARGALQRALLWVQWTEFRNMDGSPRYWVPGTPRLHFEFPNGAADVDLIPESAKLNVNTALPEDLFRLMQALGFDPARASEITAAIIDWRAPAPQGMTEFDSYYLGLTPSFRARHASIEEIEEILMVKGMTPELFHGTYVRDAEGKLSPRSGLRDCLSVYPGGQIDVNYAHPAVLAAVGLTPDAIAAIVTARRLQPFNPGTLQALAASFGPSAGRLIVGGGSIYTLRATARLRLPNGQLSDLKRTVAALVKFQPPTKDAYFHILRWYDQGALGMGDIQ
ncbi:MAG: type II secretion system protein GspK [Bryobacteraceae bacterium]